MSSIISTIHARQVLDSRGNPTVEADITLDDGSVGRATVPSGASTGSREALELRDGGSHYGGKSVERAVGNINDIIAPALTGQDPYDQSARDAQLQQLDGTDDKSHLGANAILAVSLALAHAAAASRHQPLYRYVAELAGTTDQMSLPLPMMNVMNGGQHAAGSTDIQEFMIVPRGADDFASALEMGVNTFHALKRVLSERDYATTVGDEGGYAPHVRGGNNEPLDLIAQAVQDAGYRFGDNIALALDVAASELYHDDTYQLATEHRAMSASDMIAWYSDLSASYPLLSIEDGLDENDWAHWQQLQATLGDRLQLVGDDLLVTNTTLLAQAIERQAANAILIKPNQIGTLTETIAAVAMARHAGWRTIMSHRSGETEDVTIAHLAVGLGTDQIKTGSLSRSDRVAKYNELLRIAEAEPTLQLARPFA